MNYWKPLELLVDGLGAVLDWANRVCLVTPAMHVKMCAWVMKSVGCSESQAKQIVSGMVDGAKSVYYQNWLKGWLSKRTGTQHWMKQVVSRKVDAQMLDELVHMVQKEGMIERMHTWAHWREKHAEHWHGQCHSSGWQQCSEEEKQRARQVYEQQKDQKLEQLFGSKEEVKKRLERLVPALLQLAALELARKELVERMLFGRTALMLPQEGEQENGQMGAQKIRQWQEDLDGLNKTLETLDTYIKKTYGKVFEGVSEYRWWCYMQPLCSAVGVPVIQGQHALWSRLCDQWHPDGWDAGVDSELLIQNSIESMGISYCKLVLKKMLWLYEQGYLKTQSILVLLQHKEMQEAAQSSAANAQVWAALVHKVNESVDQDPALWWQSMQVQMKKGRAQSRYMQMIQCSKQDESMEGSCYGGAGVWQVHAQPLEDFAVSKDAVGAWCQAVSRMCKVQGDVQKVHAWMDWAWESEQMKPVLEQWMDLTLGSTGVDTLMRNRYDWAQGVWQCRSAVESWKMRRQMMPCEPVGWEHGQAKRKIKAL